MEHLQTSSHPATLLKKCEECNFILKNKLVLACGNVGPRWNLFCPNLSCPQFAEIQIVYDFVKADTPTITNGKLFPDTTPDTSIESD